MSGGPKHLLVCHFQAAVHVCDPINSVGTDVPLSARNDTVVVLMASQRCSELVRLYQKFRKEIL